MKKSVSLIALASLMLTSVCFISCQKDDALSQAQQDQQTVQQIQSNSVNYKPTQYSAAAAELTPSQFKAQSAKSAKTFQTSVPPTKNIK